jgi:hypothetical protein
MFKEVTNIVALDLLLVEFFFDPIFIEIIAPA